MSTHRLRRRGWHKPHAASAVFASSNSSASDLTTYTFSAQSLGSAAQRRRIVVGACARAAGSTLDISSITLGGRPMRLIGTGRNVTSGVNAATMFVSQQDVVDTSADIVVTWNEGAVRMGIVVYSILNARTREPFASGTSTASPSTATIVIPPGGCAIGVAICPNSASWNAPTNLSEDADFAVESSIAITGASAAFLTGGSTALTLTHSAGGNQGAVFASWEP